MNRWSAVRATIAATILIGGTAAAGLPSLKTFAKIEPGEWQLRETGSVSVVRSLCLGDPAALMLPPHSGGACTHTIIADEPGTATISYSCPGAGAGRTRIAVETPRVLHLQMQGVVSGAPFDYDYEARRIGSCGEKPAR